MGSKISGATPDSGDIKQGAASRQGHRAGEPARAWRSAPSRSASSAASLIPSTRVEDEKIGPMADQVKDKARETGQEAIERGKEVARQAADSAKETAQEAGREHAEGLKDSAQQKAQETRQQAGTTT